MEVCEVTVDNSNTRATYQDDDSQVNNAASGTNTVSAEDSNQNQLHVDIDLTTEQVDIDLTQETIKLPIILNDKHFHIPVNSTLWDEVMREVLTISQHTYIPAIVSCTIGGTSFKALLDTGATVTLVSHRVIQAAHIGGTIEDYDSGPVCTATGNCMNVLGNIKVTIKIGTLVSITCKAVVVKDLSKDVIIGKDVLRLTKAKLDMENDTVTFQGCAPIPFGEATREAAVVETEPSVFRVYTNNEIVLPPKVQLAIPVSTQLYQGREDDTVMVVGIEDGAEEPEFVVNCTLTRRDALACCITNVTKGTITIPKGECIATMEVFAVSTLPCAAPLNNEELNKGRAFGDAKPFQPGDIKLGDNLTPIQTNAVRSLLARFSDVFQENLATPGQLRVPPFTIDLIDGATPKVQRNYRKSEMEHLQIKANNDDKLNKGVCELSKSAFPAPVIMAPKKDGKLRLCVDLRYINTLTIPIALEMPRADDMFYAVRGAKYFSLADAT